MTKINTNKYTEYEWYGTFNVTTEGDEEGRSTAHLGTYTGYIDEIAFHLADEAYYQLTFRRVKKPVTKFKSNGPRVSVCLDIDSGTWELTYDERKVYVDNLVKKAGRYDKVKVLGEGHYGGFTLVNPDYIDPEKVAEDAKKKLTDLELDALLTVYGKKKS